MGDQIVWQPWFLASSAIAVSLFVTMARRVAPIRSPKPAGLVLLPTAGFRSSLAAIAVAALVAALVGIYIRFDVLKIASMDWVLPFFIVMSGVLGALRLIWTRDFAVPLVNGYPILGSVLHGLVLSLSFLLTVGASIHLNLTWFLPTIPRLFPMFLTTFGLWSYFLQEEGLKDALVRTRGQSSALAFGLGSKLILALVWYGTTFLPNPPSFVGITIPQAFAALLVLEVFSAFLRNWRYGSVAVSFFMSVVIAWAVSVILPMA